jgi:hypothetical protein
MEQQTVVVSPGIGSDDRKPIDAIIVAPEVALRKKARVALKSGYLPSTIFTEEQVVTIVRAGEELGIPFMSSLRSISLVDGKITLEAGLMRALVFRRIRDAQIDFIECSSEKCIVEMQRPGGKVNRFIYTIDDAKVAGLLKKSNWQKYPISMLIARASAIGCRAIFPDALIGGSIYDPDEIGNLPPSEFDIEIERIRQDILSLAVALPEDKRTVCLDQTQEAVSRCNVVMLEKILFRVREIVEGRNVEEGTVEVEVVSDPIVSE